MTSPTPRTHSFVQRMRATILRYAAEQRRRRQDEQFWQTALADPRIMADITCAMARSGGDSSPQAIVAARYPLLSGLLATPHAS
jgi:hypothetical protein